MTRTAAQNWRGVHTVKNKPDVPAQGPHLFFDSCLPNGHRHRLDWLSQSNDAAGFKVIVWKCDQRTIPLNWELNTLPEVTADENQRLACVWELSRNGLLRGRIGLNDSLYLNRVRHAWQGALVREFGVRHKRRLINDLSVFGGFSDKGSFIVYLTLNTSSSW